MRKNGRTERRTDEWAATTELICAFRDYTNKHDERTEGFYTDQSTNVLQISV